MEREQIGKNNWLKMSEKYNYHKEMEKLADVYSHLVKRGVK
jgi:hypothetical protein